MTKETSVQKLAMLVESKFDISLNPDTFKRLYPGYWQRGGGAWSWRMNRADHPAWDIGSTRSVRYLLDNWDEVSLFGEELDINW